MAGAAWEPARTSPFRTLVDRAPSPENTGLRAALPEFLPAKATLYYPRCQTI